ncbi:MAG: tetratricopeptide repeat protein [Propionibacteriaceae bacterium]|jgi:putative thioredoxin|nr:tetratricopeptide repeat protein [Propionibacteriaceae bacterium]
MASFSAARALDLSALVEKAKNPPPTPGTASYVQEVDERSFEPTLAKSVKHPVVLEIYSAKDKAGVALAQTLARLVNEANGALLLARVDIDAVPQIAQAFGIQAVPTVLGVVAGQLVPLFQGTKDEPEVRAILAQLLQAAAQAGITGRAEPVTRIDAPDPKFAAADAALEKGDYAAAVAEYDKLLADAPNDAEAKAGRAQAAFLLRLTSVDPDAIAKAESAPTDVAAQFAAADAELAQGLAAAAFARLIELVRNTAGEERETVRARLLELFDTYGNAHPEVAKARRDLMAALF